MIFIMCNVSSNFIIQLVVTPDPRDVNKHKLIGSRFYMKVNSHPIDNFSMQTKMHLRLINKSSTICSNNKYFLQAKLCHQSDAT